MLINICPSMQYYHIILSLVCITGLVNSVEICSQFRNPLCNNFYDFAFKGLNVTEIPNVSLGLIGEHFRAFLCIIYYPPCGPSLKELKLKRTYGRIIPCRHFCLSVVNSWRSNTTETSFVSNPGVCSGLPDRQCVQRSDSGQWVFVEDFYFKTKKSTARTRIPVVGDNDENVEEILDHMSRPKPAVPSRRYDILEKGRPDLFRGWADVQGLGTANDYCRVIGKGHKKFLSCVLAGSQGHHHHYVSGQGFEPGIRNTWFMRDMDNDGKDDYCRKQIR